MSRVKYYELEDLPEDLKVCNCAGCRKLLIAMNETWCKGLPPKVRGRIDDRPYCDSCLDCYKQGHGGHLVNDKTTEDSSPSLENWIKMIEGHNEV